MAAVTVEVTIDRTPNQVWDYVRDLGSHVEWMADATEIRFLSDQREGAGTSFECDTKVGPIKLTDVMTITNWVDEAEMGVRHEGLVTGVGQFTLVPVGDAGTRFSWYEDLSFPIWLGGPVGEIVAKPILTAIWKRNLQRLKTKVEERSETH